MVYSGNVVADMDSPWMTTEQVAAYLGKTVAGARQWMRTAKVPRSPTAKTLTHREWVDAALYGNTTKPNPAGGKTGNNHTFGRNSRRG